MKAGPGPERGLPGARPGPRGLGCVGPGGCAAGTRRSPTVRIRGDSVPSNVGVAWNRVGRVRARRMNARHPKRLCHRRGTERVPRGLRTPFPPTLGFGLGLGQPAGLTQASARVCTATGPRGALLGPPSPPPRAPRRWPPGSPAGSAALPLPGCHRVASSEGSLRDGDCASREPASRHRGFSRGRWESPAVKLLSGAGRGVSPIKCEREDGVKG